jgi:hypothetical protein
MRPGGRDRISWADSLLMAHCGLISREGNLSRMDDDQIAPLRAAAARNRAKTSGGRENLEWNDDHTWLPSPNDEAPFKVRRVPPTRFEEDHEAA